MAQKNRKYTSILIVIIVSSITYFIYKSLKPAGISHNFAKVATEKSIKVNMDGKVLQVTHENRNPISASVKFIENDGPKKEMDLVEDSPNENVINGLVEVLNKTKELQDDCQSAYSSFFNDQIDLRNEEAENIVPEKVITRIAGALDMYTSYMVDNSGTYNEYLEILDGDSEFDQIGYLRDSVKVTNACISPEVHNALDVGLQLAYEGNWSQEDTRKMIELHARYVNVQLRNTMNINQILSVVEVVSTLSSLGYISGEYEGYLEGYVDKLFEASAEINKRFLYEEGVDGREVREALNELNDLVEESSGLLRDEFSEAF